MRAQLYIWTDRFWFSTHSLEAGVTRRHAVVILYSLSGRPVRVVCENGEETEGAAVLVAPNVARSLAASETQLLSFHLDLLSFEYHALVRMLGTRSLMPLDPAAFQPYVPMLRQFYEGYLDCSEAYRVFNEFVRAISDYQPTSILIDMRVIHIARRVMTELPQIHTLAQLAAHVGISPGRLTHLFSEQLGVSLKSYILWAKVRQAALMFATDKPLAEIAYTAGFADSAHLTRTFKNGFGITPSFLTNRDLVNVRGCTR